MQHDCYAKPGSHLAGLRLIRPCFRRSGGQVPTNQPPQATVCVCVYVIHVYMYVCICVAKLKGYIR